MTETEVWKSVPGHEGFYEVSNLGRVRSVDRIVRASRGGQAHRQGKLLSLCHDEDGYHLVTLCKGGEERTARVSRLVLLAFQGPDPARPFACHENGTNTDDRLRNLYWGTAKENTRDGVRHGTIRLGSKSPRAELTADQVRTARALYSQGVQQNEILRRMGLKIGKTAMSRLLRRVTYADL